MLLADPNTTRHYWHASETCLRGQKTTFPVPKDQRVAVSEYKTPEFSVPSSHWRWLTVSVELLQGLINTLKRTNDLVCPGSDHSHDLRGPLSSKLGVNSTHVCRSKLLSKTTVVATCSAEI